MSNSITVILFYYTRALRSGPARHRQSARTALQMPVMTVALLRVIGNLCPMGARTINARLCVIQITLTIGNKPAMLTADDPTFGCSFAAVCITL